MSAWVRALERSAVIERQPQMTLPLVLQQQADRREGASAIESPLASLSYGALAALSNRYSHWALSRDLRPGDVVVLLMPSGVDYLPIWSGLTRTGVIVALVNPKLSGDLLVHAVDAAAPRELIASAETAAQVEAVRQRLVSAPACWVHGPARHGLDPLAPEIDRMSEAPPTPSERALPTIDQTALYIYTSGTTGLPKAARVSHYRLMQWSHWFAGLMDLQPEDRMYNCLPLHHSVGGVVAMGATLVGGGAVVLRSQFSVSDFWRDVRDERCTLFQYIGELCRYLVAAPAAHDPPEHSLRLACGNGLSADVWEAFRSRFRIPHILEYYAATEGNFSLYNCEEEPGSIGRIPGFLAHRVALALVKFDVDAGEPIRDEAGRCERCGPDEVGAALGQVPVEERQRAGRFEGYVDLQASRRKLLHDVFTHGDAWYQTGDLMRRDARGFYYFVDRVGATFRWKGENVSTTELAAQLGGCAGVAQAVVYGVSVAGADGRAGMAALLVEDGFEPQAFHAEVAARVPDFARPVFLRIVSSLEATETHKSKTRELIDAGFDPGQTSDPLFVHDRATHSYVPLDAARHAAILRGDFRL